MRVTRITSWIVLAIAFFGLVAVGIWAKMPVQAQSGDQGRYQSVEEKTYQYVWELVDLSTGKTICEVTIDRQGQPSMQDALNICRDQIYPPTQTPPGPPSIGETTTPQPTPIPFNANQFFQHTLWRFVTQREFTRIVKVPIPELVVNASVPPGPVEKPYVTLLAYEPVKEYHITVIRGTVGLIDFNCDGDRCDIPITQGTFITFRAFSSFGDSSPEIKVSVQVVKRDDGYYPILTSITPFTIFQDSCANIWGITQFTYPKWAELPQLPDGLNTDKSLYYLASRLMETGIVNAADCPGRGFLSADSPNGCGIEQSKAAMIDWQNQYDPVIWSVARDLGIPPKIIKTLIEKESQFWPGNSRTFLDEFGLAQINQVGADVALRWDNDLFKQTCSGVLSDCSTPYASLPSWQQDMVRGSLMNVINSNCPGCVNGLDQTTANQSIEVIAHVLKANCSQTNYIMHDNSVTASYEDLWKYTLVSYHSGYQCLYHAVEMAFRTGVPANWENVSSFLDCPGAKAYVDDLWSNLINFDSYVKVPTESQNPLKLPTYIPTKTPIPTPTPILSKNTIRVFVYVGVEGKQFPNDIQWAEGVTVQVSLPDGTELVKTVVDGQAVFDMGKYPVGTEVTVSLPGMYRSYTTRLTEKGEILIPFRLQQPVLPTALP